jgi:hypothetical protein
MSLNLSTYAQDEQFPVAPPSESADQAVVILKASVGGTTVPTPSTYRYWNNTVIRLEAKPDSGYKFLHWVITGAYTPGHSVPPLVVPETAVDPDTGELIGPVPPRVPVTSTYDSLVVTQNPLNVVCGYGYTFQYEAVFVATTPPETERVEAVVVMKEASGGTTDPSPGTYTFVEGSTFTMTATPDDGYEFRYWIATGTGSVAGHGNTIITANPSTITCGFGYTYEYLAVFVPSGTAGEPSGTPVEYFYAAIIILAIVAVIGIAAALMYKSRSGAK